MFNIGDKVSAKGKKRAFEVINRIDDTLILKELESDKLNIFTCKESQVEPYVEVEKTNKIKRISGCGKESIIEYEVHDKEIIFEISEHPLNFSTALKILLHETRIYNYKYNRISPFKLNREYRSDIQGHVFTIDFINIHTYEKQTVELLRTDKNMAIEGKFKIFIPDFLEICVDRNILQRINGGYKVVKRLNGVMDYCTYLKTKPSISQLEREGYIIPDRWSLCV